MNPDLHFLLTEFSQKYGIPAVAGGTLSGNDTLNFDVVGKIFRGSDKDVEKKDKWHIGSCAKSITAVLYAKLVENGEADWHASVASLFPDLSHEISDEWNNRTVEELFLCQAGMQANPDKSALIRGFSDKRKLTDQRTELAIGAMRSPPKARSRFVYSNLSYIVVGAAIDRISGVSFENALETHVLEPLGISSLGYGPPDVIWGHKGKLNLGLGGLILFAGSPANPQEVGSDNPSFLSSAGTMHLTMSDWSKFLSIFLIQNEKLLKNETVDYLLSSPDPAASPMVKGWAKGAGLRNVSFGMQGSNTMWAATALLNERRDRISFVVCNDGRTRVLTNSARFAANLL